MSRNFELISKFFLFNNTSTQVVQVYQGNGTRIFDRVLKNISYLKFSHIDNLPTMRNRLRLSFTSIRTNMLAI